MRISLIALALGTAVLAAGCNDKPVAQLSPLLPVGGTNT